MKKLFTLSLIFLGLNSMLGQVGIGITVPNESAQLDVVATNKGLLVPRVDLTDITIYTPIIGDQTESLLVYNKATAGIAPNNVTPGYYYWNGTNWQRLISQNDIADAIAAAGGVNSGTGSPTDGINDPTSPVD